MRIIIHFKFAKFIISIIRKTFKSFIYIAILLLLFNGVYALLGMELYAGKLDQQSEDF